jgi:hypothetical protein
VGQGQIELQVIASQLTAGGEVPDVFTGQTQKTSVQGTHGVARQDRELTPAAGSASNQLIAQSLFDGRSPQIHPPPARRSWRKKKSSMTGNTLRRLVLKPWQGIRDFSGLGGDASHLWPRWLVLRAVGLVYVIIFTGIIAESSALIGPNGLLPVPGLLEQARESHATFLEALLLTPSLFWLSGQPWLIEVLEWGGLFAALALVLNFWPRMALFVCWLCLLSFARVWLVFSEPQVDWLMLEVALLCIPFAPAGYRPGLGAHAPPSPLTLFMMRWLLFRVMFGPGVAKLLGGDPHWLNFTALDVLYETAPSPTILGYYDHHLPHAWHVVEWGLTFVAELAAPLLAVFAGRRGRWFALATWIALQAGIQLTCNYGWLNTASIGLGLLLLDDQMLARLAGFFRRPAINRLFAVPAVLTAVAARPGWRRYALGAALWTHFCLSIVVFFDHEYIPKPIRAFGSVNAFKLYARFDPLHLVTEFVGSNDGGRTWRPYEFRYFPQRLDRMSPFMAPRFPRFEASLQILIATRDEPSPIYGIVAGHLLAQNPEVLRLFRQDPFPDRPPQMIRMPTYNYTFTDWATYRATGEFWQRRYLGEYLPMVYVNQQEQITRAVSELEETRIMAGHGNPSAQNRLGLLYVTGELGLDEDRAQAELWLRRAADQGLVDAQYNLAVLLAGDEVGPDRRQEAAQWCRLAAEQGMANAQDMLGIMFFRGEGMPKDPAEALAWFQTAVQYGHPEAAGRAELVKSMLGPAAVFAAESRCRAICAGIEQRRKILTK